MAPALAAQIKDKMRERATDDLLAIWHSNDRDQWSESAFDAISQVLSERGIVAAPPVNTSQPAAALPYRGVRGWLLFLCVCLVIIRPAIGFFSAVVLAAAGEMTVAAIIFAVSVFGIFAGVGLWRVAPRAVERTKTYLWATLPCEAAILLVTLRGYPFTGGDVREALGVLTFFWIWYSYLGNSKRVRNTYSN